MADRFCPNCGTEVDADARFCPSCGTTLETDLEADVGATQIPPAPPWPESAAEDQTMTDATGQLPLSEAQVPAAPAAPEPVAPDPEPEPVVPAPEPVAAEPERAAMKPEPVTPAADPAAPPAARPSQTPDLPFTWPTTLSGWLIGVGALVGAVFLIPRLGAAGNSVGWLLLLALLGIAATVFLPDRVPSIPRLRLWVLVTTMIGLGVALARAAFTIQGVDTLFLVAMLAAAGGALLLELDMDRPFPPPDRQG